MEATDLSFKTNVPPSTHKMVIYIMYSLQLKQSCVYTALESSVTISFSFKTFTAHGHLILVHIVVLKFLGFFDVIAALGHPK